jgi:A/G-specific adenine glycosylase
MKMWQGLGYYSRARNLHRAAKQVVEEFGGVFPDSYDNLLKLRGVGEYTAAAVASFSSGERVAVLDGNVYRCLSRFYGIKTPINTPAAQKEFSAVAALLLPRRNADIHNQAIMEFGALQCRPAAPQCVDCPLSERCAAFRSGSVGELPVKLKKAAVRARYFHYLVLEHKLNTYLSKREQKDIWKDLYEFPLMETEKDVLPSRLIKQASFRKIAGTEFILSEVTDQQIHKLTHQTIYARFYRLTLKDKPGSGNLIEVPVKKIHGYPVPRLIEKYIQRHVDR